MPDALYKDSFTRKGLNPVFTVAEGVNVYNAVQKYGN